MSREDRVVEEALEGLMSRRQLITRLFAMGLAVPAVASVLAESGLATPAEAAELFAKPKNGGTLRVGTVVPTAADDPVTMFDEGAILTSQMSLEYLVYPKPNLTLAPKLATHWKATNPKTWTFHLRQGVKWHNGKPFTADDVVYTMNLITNPASKSSALSAFKGILSHGHVRKVDAHTVTFHLDRGFADFPYLLSAFNYNSLILPHGYKEGQFLKGGVGTGPYILTKYTPKVGATYRKNPNYWFPGRPHVNGVELKYFADGPPIVLAMQAGALDVYPDLPYQGSQALFNNPKFTVLRNPSSAYREVAMRVDQAPFNDPRVRQALALTLDRPALITGLLHGFGRLGNDHAFAPVYPISAVTKSIKQRARDIATAKQLLAAARHTSVDVTLTTEDYLEIPAYAQVIQQQAKDAGFNIKLNVEPQSVYYGGPDSTTPWLNAVLSITDWAPRGVPSQTIDPAYLSHGIWNTAHWSNSSYDTDINSSDNTLNPARRRQLALSAARIQNDEVPAIIAYWIDDLAVTTKKVHNVPKGPAPYPDFSGTWLS